MYIINKLLTTICKKQEKVIGMQNQPQKQFLTRASSLQGKKALFFNLPLHGHVNPSLSFIEELCERGLEVYYFATEDFRTKVENTGAIYVAYPHPVACLDLILSGNWVDTLNAVYTFIDDQVEDLITMSKNIAPDFVMYDFMSPWGKIVSDQLGYPVKTVSLYATFMLRTELIPWMVQSALQLPKHILQRRKQALHAVRQRRKINHRYGLSLPFLKTLAVDGDLNFIFTSRQFHPAGNLIRNDRYVFVGNANKDHKKQPNPKSDLGKPWHRSKKPVIYASLGTVYNENPEFFENVAKAFLQEEDYTVIISLGGRKETDWKVHEIAKESEHIHLYKFVPQIEVLSKAKVFITHGGMGSASEGALAGIAMVNSPQQVEQKMVSARTESLGAGIDLQKKTPSPSEILAATKRALADKSLTENSRKMGDMLLNSTSLEKGADLLEMMLSPSTAVAMQKPMFNRPTGGFNLFLN